MTDDVPIDDFEPVDITADTEAEDGAPIDEPTAPIEDGEAEAASGTEPEPGP